MTTSKQTPTYMRYARVETVIGKEPALRKVLAGSAKDVTVFKPNGEKQDFNKEVIAVTDAIHEDGLDAHTLSNGSIIEYAAKVLLSGKPLKFKKPEQTAPAAPPSPKKVVPKPAKAKVAATVPAAATAPKVKAAKQKATAAPKPKQEPAQVALRPRRAAAAAAPPEPEPEPEAKAEGSSPKAESVAAPISPSATDAKVRESKPSCEIPRQTADGVIAYFPAVSCVSMTVSISQLLEHFMAPGPQRDDIIARVDKLTIDLKKMAIIPKPSAKENPTAAAVVD